ncbi:MAG: YhbY family RNA-binding protein [Candidatus Pacearchaeota archaeon]|nr:YhbY family RNA-binding protein [Candidatus Pacearchaeota archaeon]
MATASIQLGKQGITDNFIISLENQFKSKVSVRISVLKNARGDGKEGKDDVKKYSEEILDKLGKNYTAKIIGFVIVVKKWRKNVRD